MSTTGATQYINNINSLYPLPGENNNAQGFRDNFNNIQASLTTLNSYIDTLAATINNTTTNIITGTHIVNALKTLKLGSIDSISIGQLNDVVVIGKNANNTPAAGSIAMFPNVVPMSIESLSAATSSFMSYNTTTELLVGGTFYGKNPTASGPYTITAIDGYTVYFDPPPTFVDNVVYVTNPTFELFTVINANTVTTLLSEAFSQDVVFSAGIESTAYNTGTLVVQGGVGITNSLNINGNLVVNGNMNVQGNLSSTSTSVKFVNLTIDGDLIFTDANQVIEQRNNTATWRCSLTGGDGTGNTTGVGYHVLPSGLIMIWGTLANAAFNTSSAGNITTTISFPIIPGISPIQNGVQQTGFPNGALQVMATAWNITDDNGIDSQVQVVNTAATGFNIRFINSPGYSSTPASGVEAIEWMAIGF